MSNPSQIKVNCQYGAPMGRRTTGTLEAPVTFSNVVLQDGYDEGGAYWGSRQGTTLFTAWDEDGNVQYFDAKGKASAIQHLCEEYDLAESDLTFQEQTWTLYWLLADCPDCGGVCFPSSEKDSGSCDCGRYFEGDEILGIEDEDTIHYNG